jgi:hypothetical protein
MLTSQDHSCEVKIGLFRQWLCDQADQAREAAKVWIADAVLDGPTAA